MWQSGISKDDFCPRVKRSGPYFHACHERCYHTPLRKVPQQSKLHLPDDTSFLFSKSLVNSDSKKLVDLFMLHDMFNMTIGVISTVVDCIISTCLHQKMSVFELLGDLLANAAKKKRNFPEQVHFTVGTTPMDMTRPWNNAWKIEFTFFPYQTLLSRNIVWW